MFPYVLTSPKRITLLKVIFKIWSLPPLTSKISLAHWLICNTASIPAGVFYFPKQRKHVKFYLFATAVCTERVVNKTLPTSILFSFFFLSYRNSRREATFLRRVHTFAPILNHYGGRHGVGSLVRLNIAQTLCPPSTSSLCPRLHMSVEQGPISSNKAHLHFYIKLN